jgi:putative transposase
MVDDFIRECLAHMVDNCLSGIRGARALDRVVKTRGKPCTVVSDNGTELTARAMLGWQEALHRAG